MSPEAPNTPPVQPKQASEEAPTMITIPEGLVTPEQQARIDQALTPEEPVVNEAQKANAEAELMRKQDELARASAEAVHAAETANAARRVDAA